MTDCINSLCPEYCYGYCKNGRGPITGWSVV